VTKRLVQLLALVNEMFAFDFVGDKADWTIVIASLSEFTVSIRKGFGRNAAGGVEHDNGAVSPNAVLFILASKSVPVSNVTAVEPNSIAAIGIKDDCVDPCSERLVEKLWPL
jgi:hypothetical protein